MDLYCPITGEINCKCNKNQNMISSLKVDLKATLRKLFTDRAVYIKFLLDSIIDEVNNSNIILDRLLNNQNDIGNQIRNIIGDYNADELIRLLYQNIKLIEDIILLDKNNNMDDILNKRNDLFDNGDEISHFLDNLNNKEGSYELYRDIFHTPGYPGYTNVFSKIKL